MAVAFVAGAGSSYANRSSNALTKPAGTADGHGLLMLYLTAAATTAPTPTFPSGWVVAPGYPNSVSDDTGFQMKIWLLSKYAASEGASWTVTHAAASCQGWVGAWSGEDPTTFLVPDPTLASGMNAVNGTAYVAVAPGLTTARDGSMIVYFGTDWGNNANDLAPPSGMTERFDQTLMYVATEAVPTAGATGSRSHATNTDASGSSWTTSLVALQPPGSAVLTYTYNRGTDIWPNVASAPTAVAGQTYFDSATKLFMQYNGTVWRVIG